MPFQKRMCESLDERYLYTKFCDRKSWQKPSFVIVGRFLMKKFPSVEVFTHNSKKKIGLFSSDAFTHTYEKIF